MPEISNLSYEKLQTLLSTNSQKNSSWKFGNFFFFKIREKCVRQEIMNFRNKNLRTLTCNRFAKKNLLKNSQNFSCENYKHDSQQMYKKFIPKNFQQKIAYSTCKNFLVKNCPKFSTKTSNTPQPIQPFSTSPHSRNTSTLTQSSNTPRAVLMK